MQRAQLPDVVGTHRAMLRVLRMDVCTRLGSTGGIVAIVVQNIMDRNMPGIVQELFFVRGSLTQRVQLPDVV